MNAGKFLFDRDFDCDGPDAPGNDPRKKVQYNEEDLDSVRADAYASGVSSGSEQAHASIEQHAVAALEVIGQRLPAITAHQDHALREITTDASRLAYMIASKLAPELIRQHPMAEIEAMVTECLAYLPTEPRIVIRVADCLIDQLQPRIDAITAQTGFAGTIVLIGEPELQGTDCRIEWADGGAERAFDDIRAAVEASVERYCQMESAAAAAPQVEFDFASTTAAGSPAPTSGIPETENDDEPAEFETSPGSVS